MSDITDPVQGFLASLGLPAARGRQFEELLVDFIEGFGLSGEQAREVLDLLESFQGEDPKKTSWMEEMPVLAEQKSRRLQKASRANVGRTVGVTLRAAGEPQQSPPQAESVPERPSGTPVVEEKRLGRYLDLGVLGEGGMGEVRRVRDEKLNRSVAMKIIHASVMENQGAVSRFIEEAQVCAQLQHPNIIPIYEIDTLPDGRPCFTMKQVQGTEFRHHISAVHRASSQTRWQPAADGTSFRQLIRTFHTICVAVAYAHSKGVVHRDLKPENILIGGFGEVLVVDWGIAKVLGSSTSGQDEDEVVETRRSSGGALATRAGSVAGTPSYMSPEQAWGLTDQVGFGSDIYTLGSILYEILSGRPPYWGDNVIKVLQQVKNSLPSPLLPANPAETEGLAGGPAAVENRVAPDASTDRLPRRLVEICERAMQREIDDRYETAEALADEVRAWLEGAEKRDKALKEIETAQLSLEQAEKLEQRALFRWRQANDLLEREGMGSEVGWARWSDARAARSEARLIRRRHLQQLQGALVHDPALEAAHLALVELRLSGLVEASAHGDRHGSEVHAQQFQNHLQFLNSGARQELEARLARQLKDAIVGQRSRRGALVGRQALREAIAEHVHGGARMLTLVGTAGVGKTRLALELAEDLRAESSQAFFCDLTEASDALGVVRLVSRAMGVRLRDKGPLEHLTELLNQRPTLLVLDNLEQVLDAVGPICQDWINRVPTLRVLATSRARLDIDAETVQSIKPLTLLESVDLFVQRGQVADSRFELTTDNREVVCSLVQKLDGLPLAIELAAARLNILPLTQIHERLSKRFSLLRTRGRDAQALQGALDWSWDLLRPWAKATLSQVSIFHGGFNLAATESIVDVRSWKKSPPIFDILADLADNSLLRRDQADDGSIRYGLLESIRAYADDKLQAEGAVANDLSGTKAAQAARYRHAAWFARMGTDDFLGALDSFDSTSRWVSLFQELDNLVAAIGYGTQETAPLCCMAAMKILGMKGPVSLGVDVATQVLGVEGLPPRLKMQLEIERSKCLRISGRMSEARAMVRASVSLPPESRSLPVEEELGEQDLATEESPPIPVLPSEPSQEALPENGERLMEQGILERELSNHEEATRCFQGAYETYLEREDLEGQVLALIELGSVCQEQGRNTEAIDALQRASELLDDTVDERLQGRIQGDLGAVYHSQGSHERATEHYEQAINCHEKLGDRRREALDLSRLGLVCQIRGRSDAALGHLERSLALTRSLGARRDEGVALANLGLVYRGLDRPKQALSHYQRALVIHRAVGARRSEGIVRGNMGHVFLQQQQVAQAREAFEEAIALLGESFPVDAGVFRGSLALLLAEEDRLDEARQMLAQSQDEGADHPAEHATFLTKKGRVQLLDDQADAARVSLDQARAIAGPLNLGGHSELSRAMSELEELLESASGQAP